MSEEKPNIAELVAYIQRKPTVKLFLLGSYQGLKKIDPDLEGLQSAIGNIAGRTEIPSLPEEIDGQIK